jgi:hypothetical protein
VLRLHRIHASHMTRNPVSGRVMHKIATCGTTCRSGACLRIWRSTAYSRASMPYRMAQQRRAREPATAPGGTLAVALKPARHSPL